MLHYGSQNSGPGVFESAPPRPASDFCAPPRPDGAAPRRGAPMSDPGIHFSSICVEQLLSTVIGLFSLYCTPLRVRRMVIKK